MSNEKIDDFLSWRGQMDDPQGVPGHGLDDHEATWERLMDKINETPRRRRVFGYPLAVGCCLLLAVIPAARLFQDHRGHIISKQPAALNRVVSPVPVPPAAASQAPPVAVASPPRRSTTAAGIPATTIPRISAGHREKPSLPLPQQQHEQPHQLAALPTSPAAITVAPPDAGTARLTAKTLKAKPLRVVHINEISGREAPEPAVTASDVQRHFEIFLSPSQSRLALPPPPPDPVLLKVKLSSSN